MYPKIIFKEKLIIAGIKGDGNKTHDMWRNFSEKLIKHGLKNKLSDNGYEIRIYSGNNCDCSVGLAVSDNDVDNEFNIVTLPASEYVIFEVSVTKGYDSENKNMNKWLSDNSDVYKQAQINGKSFVVEYYDERFNGSEPDSKIEIWVPIVHV